MSGANKQVVVRSIRVYEGTNHLQSVEEEFQAVVDDMVADGYELDSWTMSSFGVPGDDVVIVVAVFRLPVVNQDVNVGIAKDWMFPDAGKSDAYRVKELEAAIRRHRDERGDDRCAADDGTLYAVLPEGDTRPERETLVTIENCEKYIACRQTGREYVSPQRRIEELEEVVAALIESCDLGNRDVHEVVGMARAAMEGSR